MTQAKLTNAVINQDTVAAARKVSNNNSCLFKKVCEGTAIILLSPEQLESSGFRSVVDNKAFSACLYVMVVDDAHLIDLWGLSIRLSYKKIGWMRSRAGCHIPVLAVTATLQKKIRGRGPWILGLS
jgi:superfamily II DNA helicase RecQ